VIVLYDMLSDQIASAWYRPPLLATQCCMSGWFVTMALLCNWCKPHHVGTFKNFRSSLECPSCLLYRWAFSRRWTAFIL